MFCECNVIRGVEHYITTFFLEYRVCRILIDTPDTRTTYQAPDTRYITQNLLYVEHNDGTSIYSYTPVVVAAVFGTTLCAYASTQLDCMNLSPRYEQTSIMGFLHTSACSSTVGAVPRERKQYGGVKVRMHLRSVVLAPGSSSTRQRMLVYTKQRT